MDDPKDKATFYARLKVMFDAADSPAPFNAPAYNRAVATVDADLAALDDLAARLESGDFGAPMIRIYRENLDNPFKAAERTVVASEEAAVFRACVPNALLDCGYESVKNACAYLDDAELLRTLVLYSARLKRF